jgi:hypothetical protein
MVGGSAAGQLDAARKALGHPKWTLALNERKITVAGAEKTVAEFSKDDNYFAMHPEQKWTFRPFVSVTTATGAKPGEVVFCHAFVGSHNRELRFELGTPGVRAWIAGVPVRNGQRIRFKEGFYDLLLEVEIGDGGKTGDITVVFRPSETPEREQARRKSAIRAERDLLERAANLTNGEVGRLAGAMLAESE